MGMSALTDKQLARLLRRFVRKIRHVHRTKPESYYAGPEWDRLERAWSALQIESRARYGIVPDRLLS